MFDIERYEFWHMEQEAFLISISVYNQEIDKAIDDVRNGFLISNEEVINDLD